MPAKKKQSEKKDKRYRAKVTVGHTADGKPIVKYASGKTRKELAKAVEELKRIYIDGLPEQRKDITFGVYATDWYNAYKKPNISPESRRHYATIFNRYLLPVLADRQLRSIRAEELQILVNNNSGLCSTAIGYITSILRAMFAMAHSQGLIDRNPAAGLIRPAAKKESRRALTEAETRAALSVMASHKHGIILAILYYTGMRRGEMAGLQWRDIDFVNNSIHVCRDMDFVTRDFGEVKTPSANRYIPVPPELRSILWSKRGIGETLVCQPPKGKLWNNSMLHAVWADLMGAMYAAAPEIEHKEYKGVKISVLTAHYFRHNYASILYAADVDVLYAQKIIGHANASTTMGTYTHLSEQAESSNAVAVQNAFEKKVAKRLPI